MTPVTVSPEVRAEAERRETEAPRELDLLAFALLLMRNRRIILGCGVGALALMLVFVLQAHPRYASTASMVIPQNNNMTAVKLMAQLPMNTADLLGGGYELYADILKSRVVGDRLIDDFHLVDVYKVRDRETAEKVLEGRTKVVTQREGLVRVTVEDTSPQRAADLANDYLRQLDVLNQQLALTTAGQERAFLERELVKEKDALAGAEVALKQVQEKNTGVTPEVQAMAGVSALATTRAQLRAAQIQLSALLASETEQNPEVVRLRSEIAGLNAQVQNLEKGAPGASNGTPLARVPEAELEFVRRKRDVAFHETLFELLEKEYELAKEQEAKNPSIVQVLDVGIPSTHKAWPPRTIYCLLAFFIGLIVGVMVVALRAMTAAYLRHPGHAEKLAQLRAQVRRPMRA